MQLVTDSGSPGGAAPAPLHRVLLAIARETNLVFASTVVTVLAPAAEERTLRGVLTSIGARVRPWPDSIAADVTLVIVLDGAPAVSPALIAERGTRPLLLVDATRDSSGVAGIGDTDPVRGRIVRSVSWPFVSVLTLPGTAA